ncbi:MAG: thiol:disulfide interchange protein DsbA/DsbL [Gammaproteobacteria bacterium]|uniref:thiol:disulfide interchange protein DsbA/DsbL n=1 Tax=Methylotuvimicrobium sp. TaxID=2822413 RepID=UPI001DD0C382|nr:thiol:disulfide interchange protein DsbA/DsbL [Gammaproteobacteria bacterium]
MLNNKIVVSVFFVLFGLAGLVNAEPPGYEVLSTPQPTQNPDKVEVIEFFWYGCPHCYHLEPHLNKWLKTKPDNVDFIRQPAIFSSLWEKHAKAYFTAEALGVVDKVHADFFDAIQNKKQKLESEDQLVKFFSEHGVTEVDFRNAYNSFPVDYKVRQAKTMAARYGVNGVPALIINGKYRTSGSLAKTQQNMIEVMNRLIEKESSSQ